MTINQALDNPAFFGIGKASLKVRQELLCAVGDELQYTGDTAKMWNGCSSQMNPKCNHFEL